MPEPEPKFNPFTGSGRRLDGRPLSYEPPAASSSSSFSSKDKQPAVANGNGQASVASSSSARQAQGKLVFGGNANRAPKEAPKVHTVSNLVINEIERQIRMNVALLILFLQVGAGKETKAEEEEKKEEPKFQAFTGKKYSLRG